DESGAVQGLYGRKVTAHLRTGTPNHLYLPGPHRCAFNSAGLAEGSGLAIVCEAILDALAFWCAGFTHVTAAYGTAGFTPHHLEALRRHQVKDVFIAYDRDDAGDAAADALAVELGRHGFDCYRVEFPRGMDANEYALKVQPASKSLGVALRHARPMGSGASKTKSSQPPLLAAARDDSSGRASADSVLSARSEKRAAVTTSAKTATPEVSAASAVEPGAAAAAHPAAGRGDPQKPAPTPSPTMAPPAPPAAKAITQPGATDDEGLFTFGLRRYRLRGLSKPHTPDTLRLNVLLGVGEAFHVDTFDLYSAKARAAFVHQASLECGQDADAVKRDVGQLLLQVEALLDKRREEAKGPKVPVLTEEERTAALELLKTPGLLTRILEDFGRCGVVGEETNKLVGYLAAVSRKLDEPLAVLIQSSSAAGKSSLMEAVLAFVPEEEKTKFSAMTGQSLFYMGDVSLSHKVLAVVEEEGASRAAYALKLLQSEGELTIASTGKDPHTGRLVTHEYRVEGPTQLFLTTTATELDEELLNRCLVLTVDEDRAQTKAIHQQQREKQTLEGLLARRAKDAVLALHQNAQRLLRPLAVINPYAHQLTFLDDRTRARRDFPKYLTLIRAIALLHQYQREVKTATHAGGVVEYVEVQASDIETANALASSVLGRTLDELPPQTRRLMTQLEAYVVARAAEEGCPRAEVRFTRRQLREALRLGDTQLHLHLTRLESLEYVASQRGARGGLAYQLLPMQHLVPSAGLTEASALRTGTTQDSGAAGRIRGGFGVHSAPTPEASTARDVKVNWPGFGLATKAHSAPAQAVAVVPMGEVP
ncbi:MAG: toprim domain-containing protein, partial [Myxococcales bacterium]|nr:toprim domain-containing protein [Myxococcales bacterium]